MDKKLMETFIAREWWFHHLTDDGRAQFPKPKGDDDIVSYYNDPADYILF